MIVQRVSTSAAVAFCRPSTLLRQAAHKHQHLARRSRSNLATSTLLPSLLRPSSSTTAHYLMRPGDYSVTTTRVVSSSTASHISNALASSSPWTTMTSMSSIITSPGGIFTSVLGIISLVVYFKYKGAIQRRLKQVKEESWLFGAGVTMTREEISSSTSNDSPAALFSHLELLQINPTFQKQYEAEDWKLISLGDYLATLRPKQLPKRFSTQDLPKLVQQELEAGLTAGLLKALGPHLGRALLPAVGTGFIQGQASSLASKLATRWMMKKPSQDESSTTTMGLSSNQDRAGLPISIMSVLALSETNAKLTSGNGNDCDNEKDGSSSSSRKNDSAGASDDELLPGANLSAMDKMKQGENVNGPSFADTDMVPNKGFVLDADFHKTVRKMETKMKEEGHCADHQSTELQTAQAQVREQEEGGDDQARKFDDDDSCAATNAVKYDPNDRKMGEPVPINPRLFPDLHLGYGDAISSHTKRQVLQMRLLAVLLNRLGANYHRLAHPTVGDPLFTMKLTKDGPTITKPTELVQGLIDMGHQIKVVPTSRMTSFGLGMCVKESDGSWSNIPLAVFLESGYEDMDGNMAPVMMPHSGVRFILEKGPLVDHDGEEYDDHDPSKCTNPLIIQHFIGIEGFCGWKSDQNPEVPFNENVESGKALTDAKDLVRAVRLAGLYGTLLNGLATDLELPFGGYGVTAVCNDSAAIIQQCMYGESYIFPLTSIGRYLQRTVRYGHSTAERLQTMPNTVDEVNDLRALVQAMKDLPSDINATPGNASNAARRLLSTMQPKRPLKLMDDSKRIMESIMQETQ